MPAVLGPSIPARVLWGLFHDDRSGWCRKLKKEELVVICDAPGGAAAEEVLCPPGKSWFLNGSLNAGTTLALCEASPEKRVTNDLTIATRELVRTPQRLGLISDVNLAGTAGATGQQAAVKQALESLLKKGQAEPHQFVRASPAPSRWPCPAAVSQINANFPVEDRAVIGTIKVKDSFFLDKKATDKSSSSTSLWSLAAVIDGHSGWQTAEYVCNHLPSRLETALNGSSATVENMAESLTKCFEDLDEEIRKIIEPAYKIGHSGVCRAGATAVACLVSPRHIVVANVGDSKAVLSRYRVPVPLTVEHNCRVPREAMLLRKAHPNESDIIVKSGGSPPPPPASGDKKGAAEGKGSCGGENEKGVANDRGRTEGGSANRSVSEVAGWAVESGVNAARWLFNGLLSRAKEGLAGAAASEESEGAYYVKGRLQLTRAFGDFHLKHRKFVVDACRGKAMMDPPFTHPYLTAKPAVAIIEREPGADEFVILASDGIWDYLSEDEAVRIVHKSLARPLSPDRKIVDGDPQPLVAQACLDLQDAALQRAAAKAKMTVKEMQALTPGQRRKHYDDMTVAILLLHDQAPTHLRR